MSTVTLTDEERTRLAVERLRHLADHIESGRLVLNYRDEVEWARDQNSVQAARRLNTRTITIVSKPK